jgi:hypothetical protein
MEMAPKCSKQTMASKSERFVEKMIELTFKASDQRSI